MKRKFRQWKTLEIIVLLGALQVLTVILLANCNSDQPVVSDPITAPISDPVCCVNATATLGMNLENIREKSRSWVFVDVYKNSSPFHSIPSAQSLTLDSDGWVTALNPGQVALSELLDTAGGANYYPTGTYNLYYDGSGTLTVFDRNGAAYPLLLNTTGHIQFDIAAGFSGKIIFEISAVTAGDHIRNIRVIMPGYEATYATQVFHPTFLTSLQNFKVLRFLNWNRANNSPLVAWSERTKTTSQTQNSWYGVAPEYIIDLANRLSADIWINIPHLASDDYITQLATLMHGSLNPDLRVFVEHSNELWGIFTQSTWVQDQGLAAGLSTDPFTAGIRFHSQRSVAIFNLFDQVFGRSARIVRVLGAGHTSSSSVSEVMDWRNAYLSADSVATAPYYGGRLGKASFLDGTANNYPFAKPVKDMTVSEVLATMDGEILLGDALTQANKLLVSAKGLQYITYEGGPAVYFVDFPTYANDAAMTALFQATCRDPGMRTSYFDNMQRWKISSGGGLYMAFDHIGSYDVEGGYWYGCWGALEYQAQTTSPKWQALLDYLAL